MTDDPRPSLLILSFSPIVSDARVRKQVELFRDRYAVTSCGHGPAPDGVVAHIEVPADREAWRYDRLAVIGRQYRRAYRTNPAVAYARNALAGRAFDVVLADDADAVGLGVELRPAGGVHADLHEYAPSVHDEQLRWRLFLRPFYDWMCRRLVARADSWTTVGDGLAREYERSFGFRPDVVSNATPFREVSVRPPAAPLRLVHSGAGLRNRGLEATVEGVARAHGGVTLDLYLTPNDPGYLDELRALAATTGGRVRVLDPVPYARLGATLEAYDLGVMVLPPVNFNYRWALPNKVFDYVQARLGVIVGPSPEMAGLVERYGLGRVTAGFRAEDLAGLIDAIDPADVLAWKRASDAAARALSAEEQSAGWVRAVDALAARSRQG